ncbi:MAG: ABC transporter ATP-binding protein [Actinobacteria bacterium]|nr:ABC transporter ATP-binding protein [Actinomycetota bacterium]MCI0545628.1 ABC transporter ATP-binding protein [Actinomycetota bacterium]MCI0678698.1 ABC transporter ATP-binding protein [Actinomycetota bacterium]
MAGVVELVGLVKGFGDVTAVDHVNLRIEDGEFFSLLGPSGCGKTTTLRLIAGFERPDAGAILIDGVDMATTPPHKRPVNTVFQSYALFPHLTVEENVGFGLRYQNLSKDAARGKIGRALELVRLSGMEKRKPTQLSGGQQQRVALARSLVLNPSVLLLDEPLGALDAKLRKALQIELKALQEEIGITFVYVTHDQEEALTMSDRIAVMSQGTVEQLGTPAEVYESPVSSYIADFLGVSNLMEVMVKTGTQTQTVVQLGPYELTADTTYPWPGPALVSIRPERVLVLSDGDDVPNMVSARVERMVYAGPVLNVLVTIADSSEIQVTVPNMGAVGHYRHGDEIHLQLPSDALRILDRDEEG